MQKKTQLGTVIVYDLRGLRCPLPVLKTDKKLKTLSQNDILEVLSDDPLAALDLEHLCNQKGYNFNRFNCMKNDSQVQVYISKK